MRYSVLAVIGIAGLLTMAGLRLSGGHANAQETPKDGLHTFAEYSAHTLQAGDTVILAKDNVGGGYLVKFVSKELIDRHGKEKLGMETVTEIHPDYVVFRKETRHNDYDQAIKGKKVTRETIVPFRAITTIAKYLEKE